MRYTVHAPRYGVDHLFYADHKLVSKRTLHKDLGYLLPVDFCELSFRQTVEMANSYTRIVIRV